MVSISKYYITVVLIVFSMTFSGCTVVKGVSKAAWGATKIGGKVIWFGAKAVSSGVKTIVYIINGKTVVSLRRQGNSLFVRVKINRRLSTELLLDTGASRTQISHELAQRLGVDLSHGQKVTVRVADGRMISALQVNLKELRIGRAIVRNVPAVILAESQDKGYDGLLGMTFLNEFIFQIDVEKSELLLKKRP